MTKVNFMKMNEDAIIPHYAHDGDACFDLHIVVPKNKYGIREEEIAPHCSKMFGTGLKCSTEKGYVMKVYPRSSTGINRGLMLTNTIGIIDTATYRGEIHIALTNFTDDVVYVANGDKVAQAEICKVEQAEILEVSELDETERGENGIGSTGV